MDERKRLITMTLDTAELIRTLRTPDDKPLPADAHIVFGRWEGDRILLYIESAEFPATHFLANNPEVQGNLTKNS